MANYNEQQKKALQGEMKHFQRIMQARRRGAKYKAMQRMVTRTDGTAFPLFDVLLVDTEHHGKDKLLGDPIYIAGPFLTPMEANAVAEEHNVGKKVFYFGGSTRFQLSPPKTTK